MRAWLWPLATLVALQEAPKTPIAWSPKKGERLRYEISQKLQGGDSTHLTFLAGVAIEAGDVGADGKTELTFMLERIAESAQGITEKINDYDSARDKEPPESSMYRVYSKMIGKPFKARMGPTGTLEAYDEIRKLIQAGVDAWPDLEDRPKWSAEKIDALARRIDSFFKTAFDVAMGKPAAVGDTWESWFECKEFSKGLLKIARTFTLKEIKEGTAVVGISMRADLSPVTGKTIKDATGEGNLTWDTTRGILKTLGTVIRMKIGTVDVSHRMTIQLLPEPPPK